MSFLFLKEEGRNKIRDMDNLTTLLNKKEYELVLELTKGNDDPDAIFCRISAFLNLGKAKDAMDLIEKKRQILWDRAPLKCLKANFELRFILEEYDEAYSDADYFTSLPYVSQEVEEVLRSLTKRIRYNERQSSLKKNYSDEDVNALLLGNGDQYEIISLLTSFNDAKTIYFSSKIVQMIKTSNSNIVKTYGLLLLIKAKYPNEITFDKNGHSYTMNPSKENLPYEKEETKKLLSMVQKEVKDPSLFNIAKDILNNFMFELFPEDVLSKYSLNTYCVALVNLSNSYLQSKTDLSPLLEKYGISQKEMEEAKNFIFDTLKNAEQIKV